MANLPDGEESHRLKLFEAELAEKIFRKLRDQSAPCQLKYDFFTARIHSDFRPS